jgi:hypothetical protein
MVGMDLDPIETDRVPESEGEESLLVPLVRAGTKRWKWAPGNG